jgi:dTDP-4-dehydrorhamnose reductase
MKKILITGGHGQVAYELVESLRTKNYECLAPAREELDITQADAVNDMIHSFKPDAVINAAAYTRVDLAEQEPTRAYHVNYEGPKHLAKACAKRHCPLVHLSTDYVFDGSQTLPYYETSPVSPLNVYGLSKRQGEIAVQDYCEHSIILRVSGVFSAHGNNFVKTILRLAKEKEVLRIVSDQVICPTPAAAIADVILQMLLRPKWGLYHYCGAWPVNWCVFAKTIVKKALEADQPLMVKNIEAITTADYPTAAKRPHYSVLNCQKIADIFGIRQPNWEIGLMNVIKQLSITQLEKRINECH